MQCKKAIDARAYSHATLEELRKGAVKRVEAGESPEGVAEGLGINRRTIYRWLRAYHYGGDDALAAKPIAGAPAKLNAQQMASLSRMLRERNPLQLKFEYALWTAAMIRKLIRREFGVGLSAVSVGRLMRRLGFTPQRPLYRAWQQDPQWVAHWRAQAYPHIAARAKREQALIFFADESGVRSDHHAGITWAPRGRTPIVKATGARFGFTMISAVNALGHFRFMLIEERVTATVFRDFLKRLITGMPRKVFLIVDGHPIHKAKLVRQFVADNRDRLALFFLAAVRPGIESRRTGVGECEAPHCTQHRPHQASLESRSTARLASTSKAAADRSELLSYALMRLRQSMRLY
jgi:transposase